MQKSEQLKHKYYSPCKWKTEHDSYKCLSVKQRGLSIKQRGLAQTQLRKGKSHQWEYL